MALDPTSGFIIDDDLLDFCLHEEDDDDSSLDFSNPNTQRSDDYTPSFPEIAEEELEWLSNKDAFPAVDTYFDILSNQNQNQNPNPNPNPNQNPNRNLNQKPTVISSTITSCGGILQVPISYPVRKRSNRRRRGRPGFPDFQNLQCLWFNQVRQTPSLVAEPPATGSGGGGVGRRCQHCLAEKTPQWRAGPMGPKTLCNACGVRYKSGRLVAEYRPASSPSFSTALHSNCHRKIMEMRKKMQVG